MNSEQPHPDSSIFRARAREAVVIPWIHDRVMIPGETHRVAAERRRHNTRGGLSAQIDAGTCGGSGGSAMGTGSGNLRSSFERLVQEDREAEIGRGHGERIHVLTVHGLIHAQHLTVSEGAVAGLAHEAHILLHMLGPHVLHRIEAHASHAGVEEGLQVLLVHPYDLRTPAQLGPFPIAPALVAAVVVPMVVRHPEPRPLEVRDAEGWSHLIRELLLQPL
mmetsp:Transcript_63703/g.136943  ORF Transcript_63703/g.136943 Transcript_63703/m.136943 type:complete len:220 (+) Transcript_63703:471-1130(+)